jgi:hypothetical protein
MIVIVNSSRLMKSNKRIIQANMGWEKSSKVQISLQEQKIFKIPG